MKQKPCRYCALAFVHNGRHSLSWNDKCAECENIKAHKENLESQRKFVEGEPITTLDTLLEEKWVMRYHNLKHIEVIKSVPIRIVL